jgi:hypothetical protein
MLAATGNLLISQFIAAEQKTKGVVKYDGKQKIKV